MDSPRYTTRNGVHYDVAPSRMGARFRGLPILTEEEIEIRALELIQSGWRPGMGPTFGERLSRFAELLGRASANDIFRR